VSQAARSSNSSRCWTSSTERALPRARSLLEARLFVLISRPATHAGIPARRPRVLAAPTTTPCPRPAHHALGAALQRTGWVKGHKPYMLRLERRTATTD